VNVIAFGAFERAEIETHARRHDAREHHVSMAPWAGGALDLSVDVVGHGIGFCHDASLKEAGAQHSQSPVMCLGEVAVMGANIDHRVTIRCSVLIKFLADDGSCSTRAFSGRRDFSQFGEPTYFRGLPFFAKINP
jgi:hypothetical protein